MFRQTQQRITCLQGVIFRREAPRDAQWYPAPTTGIITGLQIIIPHAMQQAICEQVHERHNIAFAKLC